MIAQLKVYKVKFIEFVIKFLRFMCMRPIINYVSKDYRYSSRVEINLKNTKRMKQCVEPNQKGTICASFISQLLCKKLSLAPKYQYHNSLGLFLSAYSNNKVVQKENVIQPKLIEKSEIGSFWSYITFTSNPLYLPYTTLFCKVYSQLIFINITFFFDYFSLLSASGCFFFF